MRNGDRWKCGECGNREKSPIDPECPECGRTGERYPIEASRRPR